MATGLTNARSRNDAGGAPQVLVPSGREEASFGYQFVVHEVETQDGWPLVVVKVAHDRLADHCPQLVKVISLGENRLAESAGCVATFGRLFHHKDQFGLGARSQSSNS